MKKCAQCGNEYDDEHDACPYCAKASLPVAAIVRTTKPHGSGSWANAVVAVLVFVVADIVIATTFPYSTTSIIVALIAAAGVVVDAVNVHGHKPAGDEKPRGIVGLNPLLWGLLVFLLAIVGIPMYFYERPRIVRAYSAQARLI